jgi:hypothetical protein
MERTERGSSPGAPSPAPGLLAPCGLYCGACPQYLAPKQKCGGCNSGKGFAKIERTMCGIVKCTTKQGIKRCNACEKMDTCGRLADFTTWDSFVSHAPCIENLHACKEMGEARFNATIDERRAKGEYPPAPRAKTMSVKHLWRLIKPPFRP